MKSSDALVYKGQAFSIEWYFDERVTVPLVSIMRASSRIRASSHNVVANPPLENAKFSQLLPRSPAKIISWLDMNQYFTYLRKLLVNLLSNIVRNVVPITDR